MGVLGLLQEDMAVGASIDKLEDVLRMRLVAATRASTRVRQTAGKTCGQSSTATTTAIPGAFTACEKPVSSHVSFKVIKGEMEGEMCLLPRGLVDTSGCHSCG